MEDTLNGVNLGGWLVAEKWMTPSIFAGTSAQNEYQLAQSVKGASRLRRHHESFIQESDLAWLAQHGVKLLRVPIGYWIFGDAPPYIGSVEQLDWLMKTSAKYELNVLICLHGAPDAQNNQDHSGSGNIPRKSSWLNNRQAQIKTIESLKRLAERYRSSSSLWGIEVLNEPARGMTGIKLARFYRRAYRAVAPLLRPGTRIVLSDAFSPLLLTNAIGWFRRPAVPVVMDCHLYYCFGEASRQRSFKSQVSRVRRARWLLRLIGLQQPVLVGEWSGMLPYKASKAEIEQFIAVQQYSYHPSAAMCYWSYKVEGGGRWSFRDMVEQGLLPPGRDELLQ